MIEQAFTGVFSSIGKLIDGQHEKANDHGLVVSFLSSGWVQVLFSKRPSKLIINPWELLSFNQVEQNRNFL